MNDGFLGVPKKKKKTSKAPDNIYFLNGIVLFSKEVIVIIFLVVVGLERETERERENASCAAGNGMCIGAVLILRPWSVE